MRSLNTILFILPIIIVAHSCASAQRSKNIVKAHQEDLTRNRIEYPAVKDSIIKADDEKDFEYMPAEHAVTEQVNTILDSIAQFNKSRLFIDGYTIQVYSGLRREEAMNVIKRMNDVDEKMKPELKYLQPKWVVKYGSYYTRLEAQRDLRTLKMIFPTVILVPEKVALK